jgi:enamine deaminase RidA (YjgF/YER057c/UK114 family)
MAEAIDWHEVIGFSPVAQRGSLFAISGTGPLGDDGLVVPGEDSGAQARRCLRGFRHGLRAWGRASRMS